MKVSLKSSKSTNLFWMIPAYKKKLLYLSKWEIDLNRLGSIFILLFAFLAGVFFFGDEGAICEQSEKATTTKYNTCVKQISTLLVKKTIIKEKPQNVNQQHRWMYPKVDTQEQLAFCRRVLMLQRLISPKGQTYVNETYSLMSMKWPREQKTDAHTR